METYRTKLPKDVEYYFNVLKEAPNVVNVERKLFVNFVETIFKKEKLYYDEELIEKYFKYEKYFNYSGKSFHLLDWEKCLFVLHFCVFREDGFLRFPDLVVLSGRGTGKNGYLAFEAFCAISPLHKVREYDISFCAASEENAKTSFDEIYNLLEYADQENKAVLKRNFSWTKTQITGLKTNSKIRFKTSNPKTKDGGKEGMVAFDEYHTYENYSMINVLKTGLGKKPFPRTCVFTTDGYVRGGPLDDLKEKGLSILNFEIPDNGTLYFCCKLDNEDEVHDPEMWNKANPSLKFNPDLFEEIRKEYLDYKLHPDQNYDFIVKRMNIPKERKELQVALWEDILKTYKITDSNGKQIIREIPDLTGKECVCGIDYTRRNDFLGICLTFIVNGIYYCIPHTWVCRQSADWERFTSKIDINSWENMGLLTIVNDVELDSDLVCEWVQEQRMKYKIRKFAMDSFRYDFLKKSLERIGYNENSKEIYLVRPSDIMKVVEKIGSAFRKALIVWGNNPLMRWATNNTKLVPTKNNNFVYGKIEPKSRKTDPFLAFVHSMVIVDIIANSQKKLPRLRVIS